MYMFVPKSIKETIAKMKLKHSISDLFYLWYFILLFAKKKDVDVLAKLKIWLVLPQLRKLKYFFQQNLLKTIQQNFCINISIFWINMHSFVDYLKTYLTKDTRLALTCLTDSKISPICLYYLQSSLIRMTSKSILDKQNQYWN